MIVSGAFQAIFLNWLSRQDSYLPNLLVREKFNLLSLMYEADMARC